MGFPPRPVVASTDPEAARKVQDILSNSSLRLYVNDDVMGVELGGALKNVIALAVGIADRLRLGGQHQSGLDDPGPHRDCPTGGGLRLPGPRLSAAYPAWGI